MHITLSLTGRCMLLRTTCLKGSFCLRYSLRGRAWLRMMGIVLRFVGKLCVIWVRIVVRIILLYWHFGG